VGQRLKEEMYDETTCSEHGRHEHDGREEERAKYHDAAMSKDGEDGRRYRRDVDDQEPLLAQRGSREEWTFVHFPALSATRVMSHTLHIRARSD